MPLLFQLSHFLFLVTFCDKVTKIWKYYIIFVWILQGKMDKTEKKGKKIAQLKWPKYQKPKDENMGVNVFWKDRGCNSKKKSSIIYVLMPALLSTK